MRTNIKDDNYDHKNKSSMLNNNDFLQNNYGSFKWVQGPNATVANSDLKGIGQLAAELAAESHETENASRGLITEPSHPMHNSHQPAHRKIESSFNANSYINNSSVAKTSMQ